MALKKEHIILVGALLLFSVLLLFIVGGKSLKGNMQFNSTDYLILGVGNYWKRVDNKWSDVTDSKEIKKMLGNRQFSAYSNNKFITKSLLIKNQNRWQYRDKNNKIVTIYPSFLAYSPSSGEVDLVDQHSIKLDETDLQLINKVIDNEEIIVDNTRPLTVSEKIVFDFDQDGETEAFYIASDLYSNSVSSSELAFQLILYQDGDKVQVLKKDIINRTKQYQEASGNAVMTILKFNNRSTYDIILNRYRPMGSLPSCPVLLTLKDGHFEETKTCQEVNL
ncbi:MAG: hypothetical protein RSB99_01920 [Bacilli bacterium]